MRNYRLLMMGLVMVGIGVAGLSLLAAWPMDVSLQGRPEGTALAEGANIFVRGVGADGSPVGYRGGMMMRMSCAQCHGIDGRGQRTRMFVSPDITYRNLTDPAGMLEPDGERGETFTDAQIRRAITEGIDAEGKPLAWPMPRWRLTGTQLDSLLAYLKALP